MYADVAGAKKPSLVMVSAFASGFFQYPFITFGPRMHISPFSPSRT